MHIWPIMAILEYESIINVIYYKYMIYGVLTKGHHLHLRKKRVPTSIFRKRKVLRRISAQQKW